MAAAMFAVAVAQPVATWVTAEHDFGVFNESDGRVTCRLLLTNTGNSPLLITRVQPTCGCTAGDFSRDPVAPGDTTAITLTYNPANRPGEFVKDVFVYTNATPARTVVKIRGNAIPVKATLDRNYPVAVGDLRLARDIVPLGEMTRTAFKLGYISGYNAGHDTIVVSTKYEVLSTKYQVPSTKDEVSSNKDEGQSNKDEGRSTKDEVLSSKCGGRTADGAAPLLIVDCLPDTVPPASTMTVTVRFDAMEAPQWGLNEAGCSVTARPLHLHPETTPAGDGGEALHHILVTGIVLDDFKRATDDWRASPPHAAVESDDPDRIVVGAITAGQTATAAFRLRNTGKAPLEVRRLWCPEAAVTATASRTVVKPGKATDVTVTVNPALVDGDILNTQLTVITNDPDRQQLALRVVGTIKR